MRYLLSALLVLAPAIPAAAQESPEDVRSVEIKKGEEAEFDGVLIPMDDAKFLFASVRRMRTEVETYERLFPQLNNTLQTSINTIEARNKTQRKFSDRPTQGDVIGAAVDGGIGGFLLGITTATVTYVVISIN